MTRIVIVGGGYAGFYTAWDLEKHLRPGEAEVTVIDPAPYMTYQPFLPEVAAGSIEARHVIVPLRRQLRRTHVLTARATRIDHGSRTVHVQRADGSASAISYDEIVVTAGAVTRVFPLPGIADLAIGMKRVEEAVAIRDAVLTAVGEAASLPEGSQRQRRLTVAFVGGGFAGVEGFAEVQSLARSLTRLHPEIARSELRFHLIDASERILPEVTRTASVWVQRLLERRGAVVHLSTRVTAADDGFLELSTGESIDAGLVVWTAGTAANPVIARHTDLPVNQAGQVIVRSDLRVGTPDGAVAHAWAAGDNAAVPDVTSGPMSYTTPNAQHAMRQGKRLAKNLVATIRGRRVRPYVHRNLGVVATLGIGQGIFQSGPITLTGFPAWVIHRAYHVLAVPTWDRKLRVSLDWFGALLLDRDIATLTTVQRPRAAFRTDVESHLALSDTVVVTGSAVTRSGDRGAERRQVSTGKRAQT